MTPAAVVIMKIFYLTSNTYGSKKSVCLDGRTGLVDVRNLNLSEQFMVASD